MTYPVLKGAGYVLIHTPDMIVQNGSTCTVERATNPDSEFLKEVSNHIRTRNGKFGEIMPQDEFIALMQISDAFDLVKLSQEFIDEVKPKIENNYPEIAPFVGKLKGDDIEEGKELVATHIAEGLYHDGKFVGYVKRAHDVDVNLNAHTMFENLLFKC